MGLSRMGRPYSLLNSGRNMNLWNFLYFAWITSPSKGNEILYLTKQKNKTESELYSFEAVSRTGTFRTQIFIVWHWSTRNHTYIITYQLFIYFLFKSKTLTTKIYKQNYFSKWDEKTDFFKVFYFLMLRMGHNSRPSTFKHMRSE